MMNKGDNVPLKNGGWRKRIGLFRGKRVMYVCKLIYLNLKKLFICMEVLFGQLKRTFFWGSLYLHGVFCLCYLDLSLGLSP